MDANEHPYKVAVVKDDTFYANEHPYKVKIVEGGGLSAKVVDELPEEGETGYIYLVLKEETEEGDIYDEWIWAEKDGEYVWEHLGATNEVTIMLYDSTGQNTDGAMTQKATTDALGGKQNTLTAGSNIQINNDTISATDTTYSDFTGTDGTATGTAGLVPAPATTDAGKVLGADGTWVPGGPTVVQTTGMSTTDVMSQAAATNMIYPSGSETNQDKVQIGKKNNSFATGTNAVYIGTSDNGYASGQYSVAIGPNARSAASNSIALGSETIVDSSYSYSVALGALSTSFRSNEVSVGGRNYTRYIANVTDPVKAQDASTKNYTDNLVISYSAIEGSSAPTTSTEGKYVGQLYFDTTNDKKYYLKAIDTTTDPDTYTWEEFGGGGIPTNATFWGASYDAVNNKVDGDIVLSGSYSGLSLSGGKLNVRSHGELRLTAGYNTTWSNAVIIERYVMGLAGKRIVNLNDPIDPQDAATKNYVDTAVASAGAVAFPTSTFNSILEEA